TALEQVVALQIRRRNYLRQTDELQIGSASLPSSRRRRRELRGLHYFPFLRSDLRTGAQRRNLHFPGSIPVLHFVTTLQVHRCAPPVLRLRYGRGKTHF